MLVRETWESLEDGRCRRDEEVEEERRNENKKKKKKKEVLGKVTITLSRRVEDNLSRLTAWFDFTNFRRIIKYVF